MPLNLMREIRKLPIAKRRALAEKIWDSIEDDAESPPLTKEQEAELARRMKKYRAHPERLVPLEVVLRKMVPR